MHPLDGTHNENLRGWICLSPFSFRPRSGTYMHLVVQAGDSNCKALQPHLKTLKTGQIRAGFCAAPVKTCSVYRGKNSRLAWIRAKASGRQMLESKSQPEKHRSKRLRLGTHNEPGWLVLFRNDVFVSSELSAKASAGKVSAGPLSYSPSGTSIGMSASGTYSLENGATLSGDIAGLIGGTLHQ